MKPVRSDLFAIMRSSATHVCTYTYVLLTVRIECSGFDLIFLRFCTLLRHIYARIRMYYNTYRASDIVILRCNPRLKCIRVASRSSCPYIYKVPLRVVCDMKSRG